MLVDVGEGFKVEQVSDNFYVVIKNGKQVPNHCWKQRQYAIGKFNKMK